MTTLVESPHGDYSVLNEDGNVLYTLERGLLAQEKWSLFNARGDFVAVGPSKCELLAAVNVTINY